MLTWGFLSRPGFTGAACGFLEQMDLDPPEQLGYPVGEHPLPTIRMWLEPHAQRPVAKPMPEADRPVYVNVGSPGMATSRKLDPYWPGTVIRWSRQLRPKCDASGASLHQQLAVGKVRQMDPPAHR